MGVRGWNPDAGGGAPLFLFPLSQGWERGIEGVRAKR
jgi:hypothetical protein